MNDAISTRNLKLSFKDRPVLLGVDSKIRASRITAIMGPSGCGKSTYLRCLNRMNDLIPGSKVEGEICLGLTNIYSPTVDVRLLRSRVGMVFQRPNPFPKSVRDNIAWALKSRGLPCSAAIVDEALNAVGLLNEVKDQLDRSALQLSGGQQQRLCIARALALKPEILLLDEPCSALDPVSTDRIEKLLLSLKAKYTLVLVTHNLQQARRVADDVMFFESGRLIEAGSNDEIFNRATQDKTRDYVSGLFG
jgi:phosphate transport system ATP-binding protein